VSCLVRVRAKPRISWRLGLLLASWLLRPIKRDREICVFVVWKEENWGMKGRVGWLDDGVVI
jgi:hypothetical protein